MAEIKKSKEDLIALLNDPSSSLVKTIIRIPKDKNHEDHILTYDFTIEVAKVKFRVNPALID